MAKTKFLSATPKFWLFGEVLRKFMLTSKLGAALRILGVAPIVVDKGVALRTPLHAPEMTFQ